MFVVDTNILLYAADRDAPEHTVCRRLLEGWRRQSSPWYLTWGIIYEFLRVSTHPKVFRRPFPPEGAWRFIQAVLASPSVGVLVETDGHARVASEVFEQTPAVAGNLVFDAHTAVLMREHGVRVIYTRDADFHRFPFVEVIDPLRVHPRTPTPRKRS